MPSTQNLEIAVYSLETRSIDPYINTWQYLGYDLQTKTETRLAFP